MALKLGFMKEVTELALAKEVLESFALSKSSLVVSVVEKMTTGLGSERLGFASFLSFFVTLDKSFDFEDLVSLQEGKFSFPDITFLPGGTSSRIKFWASLLSFSHFLPVEGQSLI